MLEKKYRRIAVVNCRTEIVNKKYEYDVEVYEKKVNVRKLASFQSLTNRDWEKYACVLPKEILEKLEIDSEKLFMFSELSSMNNFFLNIAKDINKKYQVQRRTPYIYVGIKNKDKKGINFTMFYEKIYEYENEFFNEEGTEFICSNDDFRIKGMFQIEALLSEGKIEDELFNEDVQKILMPYTDELWERLEKCIKSINGGIDTFYDLIKKNNFKDLLLSNNNELNAITNKINK